MQLSRVCYRCNARLMVGHDLDDERWPNVLMVHGARTRFVDIDDLDWLTLVTCPTFGDPGMCVDDE